MLLAFQEQAGKKPNTRRATEYHARHLITVLDRNMLLVNVQLKHTTVYVAVRREQGASPHTIQKEVMTLQQAMRRAAKLGVFVPKVDPSHLMPDELGKVYTPRERWLTVEQYEMLHAHLHAQASHHSSTDDRSDYLLMYCHTGVRKTELYTIEPEHYDRARHELFVDGTKTDGAARIVPLSPAAEAVLARRIEAANGDRPFPEWHTVCRDLARACERLERAQNPGFDFTPDATTGKSRTPPKPFPAVTPNDLRRTFCSWLCNADVPERVAADLLGHKDTTMVRAVYGHLDRKRLRDAVRVGIPVSKTVDAGVSVTADTAGLDSVRRTIGLLGSGDENQKDERSRADSNGRPDA